MSRQWKYQRVFIPYIERMLAVLFILCAGKVCSQDQWWRSQTNPFGPLGTATEPPGARFSPFPGAAVWREGTTAGTLAISDNVINTVRDDDEHSVEDVIRAGVFPSPEEWARTSPSPRQSEDESLTHCMCVLVYQCGEDSVIKTDGVGIFDIRTRFGPDPVYNVTVCPPADDDNGMRICCKLPPSAIPDPLPSPIPDPLPSPIPDPLPSPIPDPLRDTTPQTDAAPRLKPCGTRAGYEVMSAWHRLSGADDVSYGEFPWMLALLGPNGGANNIYTFKCGASLIHPQVALTGAHCIGNRSLTYKIRAGEYDTTDGEEALPHQDRLVTDILIPDNFNSRALYNNIALLILDEPVTPADNVGTICLPEKGDKFDDEFCVATGWGKSTPDMKISHHPVLKKVDLKVTPSALCQKELRTTRLGMFFILNPSFICAIGQRNQDTCSGDGGGPLACPNPEDPNRYSLAGVVSWGIGCGNNTPAVYANVAHNRHWIDDQLSSRGFVENEPL